MIDKKSMSQMLEAYDFPAILVTAEHEILASNKIYQDSFGEIDLESKPKCYAVSHGYDKPCDQAGEDCPLHAAKQSKRKEKVLHIHQTPNGREHVDVEMVPVFDEKDELGFFVELLKPVPLASGRSSKQTMIGSSPAFVKMLKLVTQVADTEASVLLLGESGTGKELVSQAVHMASKRIKKSLVTLECSGLSEALIESELFGHKKGAFTGANSDKPGLVEHADGGTLFLDEIGDVSLATQVKLLRLIESKTFRRVGDTEVRRSDFRLVCATHHDLRSLVNDGKFRLDLFYRINVFPIHIPSLKERTSDIPQLVDHLLRLESNDLRITQSAMERLKQHDFRGNIRELRNIISRAAVICETGLVDEAVIKNCLEFDNVFNNRSIDSTVKSKTLKDLEAQYLSELLLKHNNDKTRVAEEADISLRTLYRKFEQYHLSN